MGLMGFTGLVRFRKICIRFRIQGRGFRVYPGFGLF